MTGRQLAALRALAPYHEGAVRKWTSPAEIGHSTAVLGSLVRAGLARSVTQEESPHGARGRLVRFQIYQASPAGLAKLKALS